MSLNEARIKPPPPAPKTFVDVEYLVFKNLQMLLMFALLTKLPKFFLIFQLSFSSSRNKG